MRAHWRRWSRLALAVAAVGTLLWGTAGVEAEEMARVRVVHMSPDGPAVDVLVDGQRAIENLAFRNATEYASLPAGPRTVRVTPAGQNQTAVIDATLPLPAGQDLTVVAVGPVAQIGALPLQDDNGAPSSGNAKVRFVHASPDAPAVDIAVAGGPVLFPNVAFKGVAGYTEVPAGTYTLEVRPAGTQNVALRVPDVALQSGQIVTIFAAGQVADSSLAAVPVAYQAAGAAAMPRSGKGGAIDADSAVTSTAMLALLIAAVGLTGLGVLAVARRTR